jgi:hypothetical protein
MRVENLTKLESEKTRDYAHRNLDMKMPFKNSISGLDMQSGGGPDSILQVSFNSHL